MRLNDENHRGSNSILSRRRILAFTGLLGILPLIAGAIPAAASEKQAKESVGYRNSPKDGKNCADCAHFIEAGTCKLVEGAISPDGWCKLWTAKP